MPPKHKIKTLNNGVLCIDIDLGQSWYRKYCRLSYRPRYRRKIGILKYWLAVHKRRYFKIKDWIFDGRMSDDNSFKN